MNAGRCSRGLALVSALLVGTVASAGWQISSTHERMVSVEGNPAEPQGPRCTVVFDAGHLLTAAGENGELRLPRGTLEMFVDHDTVAYRLSGDSTLSATATDKPRMWAPAIQFHRLQPLGTRAVAVEGDPIFDTTDPEPCGWEPDSEYCEDPGEEVQSGNEDAEKEVEDQTVNYLIRSEGMMPLKGMTELRVPPSNVAITPAFDSGDADSSYWIDYTEDVWNAFRTTEGSLSLRVYFPGYLHNGKAGEHPHYVNWSIDLGMKEGYLNDDPNEVFAKLEACADYHDIDGTEANPTTSDG